MSINHRVKILNFNRIKCRKWINKIQRNTKRGETENGVHYSRTSGANKDDDETLTNEFDKAGACVICIQSLDTVGWATGRASGL